jgi:hypothetical protein
MTQQPPGGDLDAVGSRAKRGNTQPDLDGYGWPRDQRPERRTPPGDQAGDGGTVLIEDGHWPRVFPGL